MIEQHVVFPTQHGAMPGFAACPSAPGTYPPIILYMDAPGFREELCDQARRIAKAGYFCLAPDLYYRNGTLRFDIPRRNAPMSAVISAARVNLTNAMVTADTAGMIAFFDAQDKARPGPLGCLGHCMSGSYVATVAARFPRMAAAAALYGLGLVTDKEDSPHLLLDQVKGELYFAFAEVDPSVPDSVPPALQAALDKARVRATVKTVPHTHHGWLFPARADYSAPAAEQTWEELEALWKRNLS